MRLSHSRHITSARVAQAIMSALLAAVVLFVPGSGVDAPAFTEAQRIHGSERAILANEGCGETGVTPAVDALQFSSNGHVLRFSSEGVVVAAMSHALVVTFVDANVVAPEAAGGTNFSESNGAVPLEEVVYRDLWDGVTVVYEAADGTIAKSTYVVHPGGDPADISLHYNVPLAIMPQGGLRLDFDTGYISESPPIAWQYLNGRRVPIEVRFERQDEDRVGFSLGEYDARHTLYIDPTYQWHTFYGSASEDKATGIAVDSSGDVYVVGYSVAAWNGPGGESPLTPFIGNRAIVVFKLDASGSYQWHTFYGTEYFEGYGIAIDSSGNVYASGHGFFNSWNGPGDEPPLNAWTGSNQNIVVIKLDTDGAYQWHTFYGEPVTDSYAWGGIAVDPSANVYVAGFNYYSWNGPGGQAPLNPLGTPGPTDITVIKLDTDGHYQWHTFYGGSGWEWTSAIAADSSGSVYVTASSESSWNGPGPTSPLNAHAGGYDVAVLKLDTNGSYQWHTFYGTSSADYASGITVDTSGNMYAAGVSPVGWNGPLGESPVTPYAGYGTYVTFALKLDSTGGYRWHTFHGLQSYCAGIAVDAAANVYATGYSYNSWTGPGGEAPLSLHTTYYDDIHILSLDTDGAYRWHAFHGSTVNEYGIGIAVTPSGDAIYVAGYGPASWNGPGGEVPLCPHAGDVDMVIVKWGETQTIEVALQLKAGWNMVSVPVQLEAGSDGPLQVFPGAVAVYTWNPGTKSYVVPDTIVPERGYWVAMTADSSITVTGPPVNDWTDSLNTGWNMIGSVAGDALPVGSLGVDPPGSVLTGAIYWWNPESKSYATSSTIEEGKGYWAAATQGCELTMAQP